MLSATFMESKEKTNLKDTEREKGLDERLANNFIVLVTSNGSSPFITGKFLSPGAKEQNT